MLSFLLFHSYFLLVWNFLFLCPSLFHIFRPADVLRTFFERGRKFLSQWFNHLFLRMNFEDSLHTGAQRNTVIWNGILGTTGTYSPVSFCISGHIKYQIDRPLLFLFFSYILPLLTKLFQTLPLTYVTID